MTPPTTTVPQDRLPAPSPSAAPRYDPRHRGVRLAGAAVVGVLALALTAATVPEMVRDSETQSFALPEDTLKLVIVGDVGDVDVRGAAAGQETGVSADKHWSFREPQARLATSGAVTTVTVDCPGLPALGQCYADWDVTVPEDLAVVVRTSVGSVDVTGLTGDVEVRSSVGDISFAGAPSTLDLSTSVGVVDAVLERPADRVTVRTSVGDVRLTLPGGVAYDLRTEGVDPADVRVETSSTSEHEVSIKSSLGSMLVAEG